MEASGENEKYCDLKTISELFGLSDQSVLNLVKSNIVVRDGRGRYLLNGSVKAYIAHLQEKVRTQGIDTSPTGAKNRKLKAEADHWERRVQQIQMELDKESGRLVEWEDVRRQWMARLVEFKAAMLELPKRVGFRFTNADERLLVEEEVQSFVVEALAKYSRDGGILPAGRTGRGDVSRDDAAAAADNGKPVGRRKSRAHKKVEPPAGTVED